MTKKEKDQLDILWGEYLNLLSAVSFAEYAVTKGKDRLIANLRKLNPSSEWLAEQGVENIQQLIDTIESELSF